MFNISIPRGDYRPIKLKVKNKDDTDIDFEIDEIYITFKQNYHTKDVLFQKRLTNGDITKGEDGYYHFEILPEDTEKLDYDTYYFDIEICNKNPKIKQTSLGQLEITEETTHIENEV